MNWLNFFQTTPPCHVNFGRGINATINPQEEILFNKSYKAFEDTKILDAYEYFLSSLINFSNEKPNTNILIQRTPESLYFTMYQGSAKINATVTNKTLQADVIIVENKDASVALKRYVLERNYQLTYTDYCCDSEYVKLKLYINNITLSPQKIFFPLRELALNADFDKEHIVSEFKNIPLADVAHLETLSTDELQIKYTYFMQEICKVENQELTFPTNDAAGMQAFLYLGILLQFDYLLVPKYTLYHKLSKKIQNYFSDENQTVEVKNNELKKYVLALKKLTFDEFSRNFYTAQYTFNPMEKTSYEDFVKFITESIHKIRWYKNNRYPQIIPTIYRYMAFYSLYHYGLNPVLHKLLHTLVQIQNAPFFATLDCEVLYDEKNQSFSKRAIISKLQDITLQYKQQYKSLALSTQDLKFESMNDFCNSYYTMLKNLNFEEL